MSEKKYHAVYLSDSAAKLFDRGTGRIKGQLRRMALVQFLLAGVFLVMGLWPVLFSSIHYQSEGQAARAVAEARSLARASAGHARQVAHLESERSALKGDHSKEGTARWKELGEELKAVSDQHRLRIKESEKVQDELRKHAPRQPRWFMLVMAAVVAFAGASYWISLLTSIQLLPIGGQRTEVEDETQL